MGEGSKFVPVKIRESNLKMKGIMKELYLVNGALLGVSFSLEEKRHSSIFSTPFFFSCSSV